MNGLAIRPYDTADAPELALIFHRAVHAARAYSAEQRSAWSPAPPENAAWADRLSRPATLVAETGAGPVGFMTCDADGYLDLAYVAPEAQGQGVARALYAVLEANARAKGFSRLRTHASLHFEPFLSQHGWRVVARETVKRGDVLLARAEMVRDLRDKS